MAPFLAVMFKKQGGGEKRRVVTSNGNYQWLRVASSEAICSRHNRCPTSMFGGSFLHERSNLVSLWPGGSRWEDCCVLVCRSRALGNNVVLPYLIPPPISHPFLQQSAGWSWGETGIFSLLWEAQRAFLGRTRAL